MNKQEFIERMRDALRGLPEDDVLERISFYSEMIDDRMEEGLSEEEAITSLGSADDLIAQIMSEIPLGKIVKEKVKNQRSLKPWEIVLIILGFPVWFPLIISLLAIIFSLYVVLWSLVISLWAVFVALACASIGGVVGGIAVAIYKNPLSGIALVGAAILCAGLAIFAFFGCRVSTKGVIRLTPKIILAIKRCFTSKGSGESDDKISAEDENNSEYKNTNQEKGEAK